MASKKQTLLGELQLALDRAMSAGLGSFVATLAHSPSHDLKALTIAGIAAGGIALASLSNSLRALTTTEPANAGSSPVITINSSADPLAIASEVSKALDSLVAKSPATGGVIPNNVMEPNKVS